MVDMRPEALLRNDFESAGIFLVYTFEDSFILEKIHTTGRVYHLSSYFQCDYSCIDKFFLKSRDSFYIFYMPVLRRVSTLIESSFATTRSIQKDTIEYFWCFTEILSRVERHSYIYTTHTIEILKKLWYSFSGGFISDDKSIGIHFCKLCSLSSRTRCHIEYNE